MHQRCRYSVLWLGGGVMSKRKLKASRCFLWMTVSKSQLPRAILVAFSFNKPKGFKDMKSQTFENVIKKLSSINTTEIKKLEKEYQNKKQTKPTKITLPLILTLFVAACASPATKMTEHQVSQLSDLQLCQLKNSYSYEQKTEVEIGKRNLNCHPAYMQCRQNGYDNNSQEIHTCAQNLADRWALEKELAEKERELEFERIKNSRKPATNPWGIYNAPDVIINQR